MPMIGLTKAFTSVSNDEADYVCDLLNQAGIQAAVKPGFPYMNFGEEPEVWIAKCDIDRARPVLDAYLGRGDDWRMSKWRAQQVKYRETHRRAAEWHVAEERAVAERRATARTDGGQEHETIEVVCEECGNRSRFPISLRGRAEDCP